MGYLGLKKDERKDERKKKKKNLSLSTLLGLFLRFVDTGSFDKR